MKDHRKKLWKITHSRNTILESLPQPLISGPILHVVYTCKISVQLEPVDLELVEDQVREDVFDVGEVDDVAHVSFRKSSDVDVQPAGIEEGVFDEVVGASKGRAGRCEKSAQDV